MSLGELAVIDLPDFDSIAAEHRERVDALLPRVDAVAWIVDPEKYKDEVMHGGYLRTFAPRLRHQLVVLNKGDTLSPEDATRVSDDMRTQLQREGLTDIEIVTTRARDGAAGVSEFRTWLDSAAQAKRVIAARVAGEAHEATADLAKRAGVANGQAQPLIDPAGASARSRPSSAASRADRHPRARAPSHRRDRLAHGRVALDHSDT